LDELRKKGISAESTIPEDQIRQQWRGQEVEDIVKDKDAVDDSWTAKDTSAATQLSLF
jgi:hypothetical protein